MVEIRAIAAALFEGLARDLCRSEHHSMAPAKAFSTQSDRAASPCPPELESGTSTAGDREADFMRRVSHDLRTPVQAILGWVSLLRGGQLPSNASARALAAIERNAKLQSEVISKVLADK